jgi:hypothetical protein
MSWTRWVTKSTHVERNGFYPSFGLQFPNNQGAPFNFAPAIFS